MSEKSEGKKIVSSCPKERASEDVLTISQSFPFAVSSHGTRKNIFRANWNGDRARRRRDEGIAASLAKSCREFFCSKRVLGTVATGVIVSQIFILFLKY